MSSKKSPSLPDVPEFFQDPRIDQQVNNQLSTAQKLKSLDLTGDLAGLADTISVNPEVTKMFLSGLQAQLAPMLRDARTATRNELAANNQLESSTSASMFGQLESDYQNKLLTQSTQFGLADIERALNNKMKLFGTGLDLQSNAIGGLRQDSSQRNQFNLSNYENLVAQSLYGQNDAGGLMGGLTGAAGGALAGATIGGIPGAAIGGIAGGLAGGFGSSGVGMGILQGGAGMAGTRAGKTAGALGGGLSSTTSYAKNLANNPLLDYDLSGYGRLLG